MRENNFKLWLQDHIYTPSELESYLLCPYRFYAESFLKLEADSELEVELSPSEIGSLLHRVLEKILKSSEPTCERAMSLLEQEITERSPAHPQWIPALVENQKKKIALTITAFLEDDAEERKKARSLQPRFMEWSFGKKSDPLVLTHEGKQVRLAGRVDRIDVDEEAKRFLVIDYKTGSTKITGNQIRSGASLQLPLYIWAVQKLLLPDYEPVGGLYYSLWDMSKKDGILHADRLPPFLEIHPRSSSLIPAAQWKIVFQSLRQKVFEIVAKIEKEEFPTLAPDVWEPCEAYCPYQDICRMRSVT